jgi:hypothetical protein
MEVLLLYASVCLEVTSLARSVRKGESLQELASSVTLSREHTRVQAGEYAVEVLLEELAAFVIRQHNQKSDELTVGLSLRQLSLLALFGCNIKIEDDTIAL